MNVSLPEPIPRKFKRPRRNVLVHLDSNVLHLVLDWLNLVDIGNFDMAASDSGLRVEYLVCLCSHNFVAFSDLKSCDKHFDWALKRQLKIQRVTLTNTNTCVELFKIYIQGVYGVLIE